MLPSVFYFSLKNIPGLTLSLPLWIIKNDPNSHLGYVNIWSPKGGMKGGDDT